MNCSYCGEIITESPTLYGGEPLHSECLEALQLEFLPDTDVAMSNEDLARMVDAFSKPTSRVSVPIDESDEGVF